MVPCRLRGRSPASAATDAEDQVDVVFVDLPLTTFELGRRFKEAWAPKRFVRPHELHLGFRYMVAALERAGYRAHILFPSPGRLGSPEALLDEAARLRPRLVGFTTYEGSLAETLGFAERLRSRLPDTLICLGGHLATFSFQEILRDFPDLVDVIVLGEGEQTIVDIATCLRSGQSGHDVPGTVHVCAGKVVRAPVRPALRDLDALAFPVIVHGDDRGDRGDSSGGDSGGGREVPLFVTTSRGCYAHCTFCRAAHFGQRWRPRDPVAVVDELERAYADGVRTFELVDDNFLGPGRRGRTRATAFAREVLRRGLDIRFHASCRVNDVDEETMRLLQQAGLFSLSLGVESGIPRQLQTFDKSVTAEQNEAVLRLLDGLGIPTLAYIIFFDPYLTLAEIGTNLQFLQRISALDHVRFEEIVFRRLIPVSGTPLFDRIARDGLLDGTYISGHSFRFREPRVAILADFLEAVDLRIERAFQTEEFRRIPGLYPSLKERVELDLASRCLTVLADPGLDPSGAVPALEAQWSLVLKQAFAVKASSAAETAS